VASLLQQMVFREIRQDYDIQEVVPTASPIQARSAFSLQAISSFSSPASAATNSIVTRIDETILPDNTLEYGSDRR
jgi:hypothetical protein